MPVSNQKSKMVETEIAVEMLCYQPCVKHKSRAQPLTTYWEENSLYPSPKQHRHIEKLKVASQRPLFKRRKTYGQQLLEKLV